MTDVTAQPGDGRGPLRRPFAWCAALSVLFVVLWLSPDPTFFSTPEQYVALHTMLEFVAMAVSVMVFALAWNLRRTADNAGLMILGSASLAVVLIGIAHTLSYSGMPDLVTPSGAGKAINFWLAARTIAAMALLLVALLGRRTWPVQAWWPLTLGALAAAALVWWVGLFHADALPVMFVEGQGLTPLKVGAEYLLVMLYAAAAALLLVLAKRRAESETAWLGAAAWTFGLSELCFTMYAAVTDIYNLAGHVYLVIGNLMIYNAVFAARVREPHRLLDDERSLFRALIDALPDAVTLKNPSGRYLTANRAYQETLGRTEGEIVGRTDADLFSSVVADEIRALDDEVLSTGTITRHQVARPLPPTGELVYFDTIRTPYVDATGTTRGILAVHHNVTEQLLTNDRIDRLVNFDSLTGLPNQTLFTDRVNQEMHHSDRHIESLALVTVDLDDFKAINDTIDHAAGDTVLAEFARRLLGAVREGDTVARLDGDEFAILMPNIDGVGASMATERLLDLSRRPYRVNGLDLIVTASAGIALGPDDGDSYPELHRCAETALHAAKARGKNTQHFFSQELQDRATERLQVLAALRQAIPADQLRLHYQPQVSLAAGRVVGIEALVRWQHPELGLLAPDAFIPIAEETALIHDIGAWVLRTAVRDAVSWLHAGLLPDRVSVNVSANQLHHGDLVGMVEETLREHSLPAEHLEIELTETAAMSDPTLALATMERLHAIGVGIALDDFGTGYSSMAYLKRIAAASVKIDRSFIEDLPEDANDAAIVVAIIRLAQSLSCSTIAEGVETHEQFEFLREHGCDIAQGYLVSRPIDADAMTAFLAERRATATSARS